MFTFGYGPALSKTGEIAWGARGIDDGNSIGFLWDRQTWYLRGAPITGEETDNDKAAVKGFSWLLTHLLEKEIQPAFIEAKNTRQMRPDKSNEVVLYEDWFIKATANTNGSHGYVYVTVASKPLPDLPVLRELKSEDADRDAATWKAHEGYLVWSADERPEIGSRVVLETNRGSGLVVGWTAENGYLFAMVLLDEEQKGMKLPRIANAMGREWTYEKEEP